jgi:hypothetical protein
MEEILRNSEAAAEKFCSLTRKSRIDRSRSLSGVERSFKTAECQQVHFWLCLKKKDTPHDMRRLMVVPA